PRTDRRGARVLTPGGPHRARDHWRRFLDPVPPSGRPALAHRRRDRRAPTPVRVVPASTARPTRITQCPRRRRPSPGPGLPRTRRRRHPHGHPLPSYGTKPYLGALAPQHPRPPTGPAPGEHHVATKPDAAAMISATSRLRGGTWDDAQRPGHAP